VERIRTTEVSEEELKTAKDTALNSLVFAFDTKAKTLGRILNYEYFGYPRDFIQQYQRAIEAVTRADVLRVAKLHLAPADFTIVAVGNAEQFGQPLSKLGRPVTAIDLTIPEAKKDAAQSDAASVAKGRAILERVQQAVGGAAKLAAVKDFTSTQNDRFDPSAGRSDASETDRWIAPSHLRMDSQEASGRLSTYCDGKLGWVFTARGSGPLRGAMLQQLRNEVFHVYFSLLLAGGDAGASVVAVDDRTVGISAGDQVVRLVVDPATGLPRQLLYDSPRPDGPPQPMEEEYSDFREVKGIQVPFHVTYHRGGKYLADSVVSQFLIDTGLQLEDLERHP
jgi:hypothetical protein